MLKLHFKYSRAKNFKSNANFVAEKPNAKVPNFCYLSVAYIQG